MPFAARRSFRSSLPLRRYVSSQANPQAPSLPPSKLRALVSIYHQSAHFITPNNLSSAIDQAFIGDPDDIEGITTTGKEMGYRDLSKAFRRQQSQVKTGTWRRMGRQFEAEYLPMEWSDGDIGRNKKIVAALYGTDEDGKPGLDVLKEERERLINNIEEEKK
jgi:hypothetical protein